MKRLLTIAMAIVLLGLPSCHKECPSNQKCYELEGYWYEETYNEEIHFYGNGKFYDKYANYSRTQETEGNFEYNKDAGTLTEYFVFLGQNQVNDYDINWINENQFALSSDIFLALNFERIVSRHTLLVGNTDKINTNGLDVKKFESSNPRIVSVNEQGQIKAEGEKGTAYIKLVTSNGNLWASATVGDNTYDLWCDYTHIIGMSFKEMCDELISLGKPIEYDEKGDLFYFNTPLHDVIDHICVLLDLTKDAVVCVSLITKESVSDIVVNSYLNSKYYPMTEGEKVFFYTTEDIHNSTVLINSSRENDFIGFYDKNFLLLSGLWEIDYGYMLGKGRKVVQNLMEGYGGTFVMTDFSYSQDGSDYYFTPKGNCAYLVGYVLNSEEKVSQLWIYLYDTSDPNEIFAMLNQLYYLSTKESTNSEYVFYDKDKKMKIVFDLYNIAVIYTDLTVKQYTPTKALAGEIAISLKSTWGQNDYKVDYPAIVNKQTNYMMRHINKVKKNFEPDSN